MSRFRHDKVPVTKKVLFDKIYSPSQLISLHREMSVVIQVKATFHTTETEMLLQFDIYLSSYYVEEGNPLKMISFRRIFVCA